MIDAPKSCHLLFNLATRPSVWHLSSGEAGSPLQARSYPSLLSCYAHSSFPTAVLLAVALQLYLRSSMADISAAPFPEGITICCLKLSWMIIVAPVQNGYSGSQSSLCGPIQPNSISLFHIPSSADDIHHRCHAENPCLSTFPLPCSPFLILTQGMHIGQSETEQRLCHAPQHLCDKRVAGVAAKIRNPFPE